MGFALRWGGYRAVIAKVSICGIKVLIPVAGYGTWRTGKYIGNEISDRVFDLGDGATATLLDLSPQEEEEQQKETIDRLHNLARATDITLVP